MITKEEGDYLSNLNEELFGKINTLTVELEIARLEFTQIFDAVSDPLWVIDNEYTVIHINRAFLKLLKIDSKAAVLGKKCYEILNYGLRYGTDSCEIGQYKKICYINIFFLLRCIRINYLKLLPIDSQYRSIF